MNGQGPNTELVDSRGRKYLTRDERERFLAAVGTHPRHQVQTLARTLALTGCRVSEALAICACDVDLEAAELRIATLKRRRAAWRAVPVPEDVVHALCSRRVRGLASYSGVRQSGSVDETLPRLCGIR